MKLAGTQCTTSRCLLLMRCDAAYAFAHRYSPIDASCSAFVCIALLHASPLGQSEYPGSVKQEWMLFKQVYCSTRLIFSIAKFDRVCIQLTFWVVDFKRSFPWPRSKSSDACDKPSQSVLESFESASPAYFSMGSLLNIVDFSGVHLHLIIKQYTHVHVYHLSHQCMFLCVW